MNRKKYLKNLKRVVIKLGTSTLTYDNGHLNYARIEKLVREIADINNRGIETIVVSSGAIGAGFSKMGFSERPKNLPDKQAAAAVGQVALLHIYQKLFLEYDKVIGQILLNSEDLSNRKRFLNARNTFLSLLNHGIIPIINENDAVVVEEIKVGDNDSLSAMVCNLIDADLLIILSDIDGLYDKNPREFKDAKLLNTVEKIDNKIMSLASDKGSSLGTGGMITKLKAGNIVNSYGANMIIANGSLENVLTKIIDNEEIGTIFLGNDSNKLSSKKTWISYTFVGEIYIDSGAKKALSNRKSLLPSGIIKVNGKFEKGDSVKILDIDGNLVGYGISNYSFKEVDILKGSNSARIGELIGYSDYEEIIHANNLVVVTDKV